MDAKLQDLVDEIDTLRDEMESLERQCQEQSKLIKELQQKLDRPKRIEVIDMALSTGDAIHEAETVVRTASGWAVNFNVRPGKQQQEEIDPPRIFIDGVFLTGWEARAIRGRLTWVLEVK